MTIHMPLDPIQGAPDWFCAGVEYAKNGGQSVAFHSELIDNRNPKCPLRMVNDDISVIALKCFLILIALPFYTVGVIATHVLRCFTLIATNLVKGRLFNVLVSLVQEIVAVVKTLFYSLAIVLCAVAGVLPPCSLAARSAVAQLEAGWSGSDRYHSVQRLNTEQACAAVGDYFTNHTSKATFFLAFCFQPIGELNDPGRVIRYQMIQEGETAVPFPSSNSVSTELTPLSAPAVVVAIEPEDGWWKDQGS